MFEPDELPVRSIARVTRARTASESTCLEPTASTVASIDPANLLARIEALEALLAASNEKITSLQTENVRLQNQIAALNVIDEEEEPSLSPAANSPPRKVAKKAAKGHARSANDEEFPALPSTSRATTGSSASSNRFAPLASISDNQPTNSINKNSKAVPKNASASNQRQQRKKVIQAIDTSLFAVRRQLCADNVSSFSVKQSRSSGPIKIVISDEAEVVPAKSALVEAKTSFHEFKWADEKQKCFVIRGLVGATAEDLPDIKQELCEAGLPENIVVSLHQTGYIRANKSQDAPVKLLLPAGADASILQKIRFLNHIAVRFDLFRSKSVVQCKNCQRFGHSAGGCQHPHRCVKCGENHLREDCPRTHDASFKLRCCNCMPRLIMSQPARHQQLQQQQLVKPCHQLPGSLVFRLLRQWAGLQLGAYKQLPESLQSTMAQLAASLQAARSKYPLTDACARWRTICPTLPQLSTISARNKTVLTSFSLSMTELLICLLRCCVLKNICVSSLAEIARQNHSRDCASDVLVCAPNFTSRVPTVLNSQ